MDGGALLLAGGAVVAAAVAVALPVEPAADRRRGVPSAGSVVTWTRAERERRRLENGCTRSLETRKVSRPLCLVSMLIVDSQSNNGRGGTRLELALDEMALLMTPTRRQLHVQPKHARSTDRH